MPPNPDTKLQLHRIQLNSYNNFAQPHSTLASFPSPIFLTLTKLHYVPARKRNQLLTSTTEGIVVSVILLPPIPGPITRSGSSTGHCNAVPSLTWTSSNNNAVAVQQASFGSFASLFNDCLFFRFFSPQMFLVPSHQAPHTILSSFAGKAAGGEGLEQKLQSGEGEIWGKGN